MTSDGFLGYGYGYPYLHWCPLCGFIAESNSELPLTMSAHVMYNVAVACARERLPLDLVVDERFHAAYKLGGRTAVEHLAKVLCLRNS